MTEWWYIAALIVFLLDGQEATHWAHYRLAAHPTEAGCLEQLQEIELSLRESLVRDYGADAKILEMDCLTLETLWERNEILEKGVI